MKRMPCSSAASGVGVSVVVCCIHSLHEKAVGRTFEPLLGGQGLTAPYDHVSSVEMHEG